MDPAALTSMFDQWLANMGPSIRSLGEYWQSLKAAGLPDEVANALVLDAAGNFGLRWTPTIKLPGFGA